MSHRGPRPPKFFKFFKSFAATGAVLALALALTGCSDGKKKSAKTGPPPPSPSAQPEANAAPGSLALKSKGLSKPVVYNDKVTVAISDTRYVRNKEQGPGEMTGRVLTIFTLRFSNGSAQPLDLNKVRVVARYGPKKAQASPTSYANINDFYGTVAPGGKRSASYAFDLPATGYRAVVLGVGFDAKHKTALFAGSLHN